MDNHKLIMFRCLDFIRLASSFSNAMHKRNYCNFDVYTCFQSPDIYKVYVEELKNGRVPYKDSPELLLLLLEFSSQSPTLFGEFMVRLTDNFCR